MEILKVLNLTKIYGKGESKVVALDDVSFTVEKGEFVAIVGASGSGKSTLLHLIGGVDKPTKGQVFINDKDIYILHDNFNFINIVSVILVILLLSVVVMSIFIKSFNLFDTIVKYLSLSSIYIFLIDILFITAIVIVESKFIFRSLNIKYIEKNINNLDKIINSKKFKIDKIEDISLTNNNTYMAMYENAINNIIFDSKYERYDDLILLINERCSLTEEK